MSSDFDYQKDLIDKKLRLEWERFHQLVSNLRVALIKQGIKPYALVLGYDQQFLLKSHAEAMPLISGRMITDDPCRFDGLVIIDAMVKSELRVLPFAT